MPYSWAGGAASGPTHGQCASGTGGDLDCHVVGFDCSGLMMYAWGAYLSLPHLAAAQQSAGLFHPTRAQLRPGDLVFFSAYLPNGVGHVAIYTGDGMVIEAPQSGAVVRRSALADLIAFDGYRGAVRPLTGPTPTLTAPQAAVPSAGGMVTVRGEHLAHVTAVQVGGATVHEFVRHSDSAIVFRAPAHAAGSVALTVSTAWGASSKSVRAIYLRPHPAAPADPRRSPAPRPSSTSPAAPKPTHAPPTATTAPPKPKPTPTAPPTPTSGPSSPTPAPSSPTSAPPNSATASSPAPAPSPTPAG
jgi:hypothetical protein